MKKVFLMTMGLFLLMPRLGVADELKLQDLLGENWYGLYLNGQKAGYLKSVLEQGEEGRFITLEDARFQINMLGIRQDMQFSSSRTYSADGDLLRIESHVVDPAGKSEFVAVVDEEGMLLTSVVNEVTTETRLPRPQESLEDALKHVKWVRNEPEIGDTLEFRIFEPMYQKEVEATSYILGVEERVFDGVPTQVYKIKTAHSLMGIESLSYVTSDGTTLEDVVAGIITMRLEPEQIAKDVDYNNDVIVSNAALIDKPIKNARKLEQLRLHIEGPLTADHMFNDSRQSLEVDGDKFLFEARRLKSGELARGQLPVEDAELVHWTEPTLFVQSDHPRIIEKAREIVGDERDPKQISNKLSEWVYRNVRSTFSARLTNALEVLDSMEGDCTEHSILFIALARAAGLPAREVAGLVYVEGAQPGFYFHQWAKVWVGEWIDVDPTFNQNLADVTHIKLAEGDLFRQARLIPVIGQLKITVLEDAPLTGLPPVDAHETAG